MKILQILPSLTAGGAESFITNLSVTMQKLGIQVHVHTLGGARNVRGQVLLERLQQANVQVTGTDKRNPRHPGNILTITQLIRKWRPDVVQANLFQCEYVLLACMPLAIGHKPLFVRRLASSGHLEYKSRLLLYLVDRFFPLTIACSDAAAKSHSDRLGAGQKSQIFTIPNGVHLMEHSFSNESRQASRSAFTLPLDAFVVAHIGRFASKGHTGKNRNLAHCAKAQDILLKAFAKAFKNDSGCYLTVLGDGPLRKEAEGLARSLGIAERTRFLGEAAEPWPTLQSADIFCFPSRYEGLPNVLIEAASCGLPVVASDIPEIRNIAPEKGWLLKPVDDIDAFAQGLQEVFANQEAFKNRAAEAACQMRKAFSMETCAQNYMKAYEDAITR